MGACREAHQGAEVVVFTSGTDLSALFCSVLGVDKRITPCACGGEACSAHGAGGSWCGHGEAAAFREGKRTLIWQLLGHGAGRWRGESGAESSS